MTYDRARKMDDCDWKMKRVYRWQIGRGTDAGNMRRNFRLTCLMRPTTNAMRSPFRRDGGRSSPRRRGRGRLNVADSPGSEHRGPVDLPPTRGRLVGLTDGRAGSHVRYWRGCDAAPNTLLAMTLDDVVERFDGDRLSPMDVVVW